MSIRERLSGNEAIATAMRQINPDVMPAFPITPSTEIPQYFSSYVANGQVDTIFIPVESEHSAMSACIGSEAAGARTVTATSSAGFAYMWEMLGVAASYRLPITLALVNRALTGPININCDHSDGMGARDCGWIQIFCENNQEAYDNYIQAFRIAEHKDVRLPIMICQDGFITSHGVENIELLEDREVKSFVGEYKPENYLLNPNMTFAVGSYGTPSYYMEAKRSQAEGMMNAKDVAIEVGKEFGKLSGRNYGLFEEYKLDDANYAIVVIGSTAGTAKDAVDRLREKGKKVGLLKIRLYRPFPGKEIAQALRGVKVIGIMDRAEGMSSQGGPLGADVKAALFDNDISIKAVDFIYGLGGRDVRVENILEVFENLEKASISRNFSTYEYLSVRD